MSPEELISLAEDVRQTIISTCLRNGGHLGASLGAVELALALHVVFDSPREPLVWDVGHQAYAHKLLTGRWDRFSTLRHDGGLSGFLSRDESTHDVFGAGHSSTALSAALAMAWARSRKAPEDWTVAIVGDGGMTAGVAFEALNNARSLELAPFLVVLNDNQMSISPNVGAVSSILSGAQVREFFELLGFDYIGPVDGHDLRSLLGTLRGIKSNWAGKPIVLHALTQKGKGYAPAEESPAFFHGVSPLKEKIPDRLQPGTKEVTYSEAFGIALCEIAAKDERVVAITAAMTEGTGLVEFSRRFPDRFFDVGIAEQHAVVFAAGLATQGFKPVVAIYRTFLQRAFDQLIHDVALQRLPVVFAVDRGGVVGADGPTHHGAFDLSYLSLIPEMTVTAATCLDDLPLLLEEAIKRDSGPTAIRFPRGAGPVSCGMPTDSGGVRTIRSANDPRAIVIGAGHVAGTLMKVAEETRDLSVEILSTSRIKPMDLGLLQHIHSHPNAHVLSCEAGVRSGGFGERLRTLLGPRGASVEVISYPDEFIPHGSPRMLDDRLGLSEKAWVARLRGLLTTLKD